MDSIRIKVKKESIQMFVAFLVLALLSAVVVRCISENLYFRFMGVIWLLIISGAVLCQTKGLYASSEIKQIIFCGYFLRVIAAGVLTYAKSLLQGFFTDSDESTFLRISLEYFHGDFRNYSTNLPRLVNWMYHIFGVDEFVIRVVFIYLWFLGILLLEKVARELRGKAAWALIIFYTFLPWAGYISTMIFREPVKQYSLMLSLYFLWKWMGDGKLRNIGAAMLGLVPALWFHSGEVAMLGAIALTYLMWDYRRQRWRKIGFNIPTALIMMGILLIPAFYNIFVKVFPGKFSGTFAFWALLNGRVNKARTVYVTETVVNTLGQFFYWTVYRMFYFWASPTLRFWNSSADMLAFVMDTVPWIIFLAFMVWSFKKGRLDLRAWVSVLVWGFFTFIYGWGTDNAGTAMRHRDHLLGVFVMTALMRRDASREKTGECSRYYGA